MEKHQDDSITSGYVKDFSQSIQHYGYQDKGNFRRAYKKFVEVLNRITNAKA